MIYDNYRLEVPPVHLLLGYPADLSVQVLTDTDSGSHMNPARFSGLGTRVPGRQRAPLVRIA